MDEDLIRLGLALYEETKTNGAKMYRVHDLVFDESSSAFRKFMNRLTGSESDFWKFSEDLALGLSRVGIAVHSTKLVQATRRNDYFLQLTPFGRKLFDLAHAPTIAASEIEGLSMLEAMLALRNEKIVTEIVSELSTINAQIDDLNLSNFQKASAHSYVNIIIEITNMPDPDINLFWLTLERASYIAGVASLIVAVVQLKMSN